MHCWIVGSYAEESEKLCGGRDCSSKLPRFLRRTGSVLVV